MIGTDIMVLTIRTMFKITCAESTILHFKGTSFVGKIASTGDMSSEFENYMSYHISNWSHLNAFENACSGGWSIESARVVLAQLYQAAMWMLSYLNLKKSSESVISEW